MACGGDYYLVVIGEVVVGDSDSGRTTDHIDQTVSNVR